jgi:endonuclease/exonuclease/phosphatase (EEP) superfamily protein YafD
MLGAGTLRVHPFVIWHIFAWSVLAALAAVAVTAVFGVSSRKVLAAAHDALPYLLILAWPITLAAFFEQKWPLAAAGGVLVSYHLALMIPRIRAEQVPRWVANAPRLELVVANVYIDNETPDEMAQQLVASGADVIVVAEWNDTFANAFAAAGADDVYPHRLCNECDNKEYVVTVASKTPLAAESRVDTVGPLVITHAVVSCGPKPVGLLAVHPTAMVDPGGYDEWQAQLDALMSYIPSVSGPFIIAGDLNSTRFRPEFQQLLDMGLIDAHDTLGRGLSTSFRLSAKGALAAAGTVVRLDHALLSAGVWPVAARDLEPCGSDHVPFALTVAVHTNTKEEGTKVGDAAVPGEVMSRSTM